METTMEKQPNIEIDMRQVPPGYVYCFNGECQKHEECLRYIVGQQVDKGLTVAPTVLPTVLRLRSCPHFQKAELMRMAWGFDKLFAEVKVKDGPVLREKMRAYLGGMGTYSRYKLGRRMLTPEQQEHIIGFFRKKGYTEGLEFDHYVTVYDLDH